MAKKVKNKTIFSIVAAMLGLQKLTNDEGKIELSDDQKEKIRKTYGQDFFDALMASDGSDEDATEIFDKMVKAGLEKDGTIAQLQKTVTDLSQTPEPAPRPKTVVPAAAPKADINMSAKHNMIAAQALTSANPAAVLATMTLTAGNGIDVTDLNAELSTAMPEGVRLDILAKRIYNGFDDAQFMTKHQTNTDYKASAALMTEVSQQFTPAWTPKGTGKFTPLEIKYRRHKINVEIIPAEILKSWLLYLYEQGKTQAEMPIVRYMIENMILPKVTDDITLKMIGKGKFVEVQNAQIASSTGNVE